MSAEAERWREGGHLASTKAELVEAGDDLLAALERLERENATLGAQAVGLLATLAARDATLEAERARADEAVRQKNAMDAAYVLQGERFEALESALDSVTAALEARDRRIAELEAGLRSVLPVLGDVMETAAEDSWHPNLAAAVVFEAGKAHDLLVGRAAGGEG